MPHTHDLGPFTHSHAFGDPGSQGRERALWAVTWVTLAAMAVELAAGYWSASLALVADGWHMGTHALALGGAALAAWYSRRLGRTQLFNFGGWKIEVLAAYTSGVLLLAVSVWIAVDAISVLRAPRGVAYAEAMVVAAFGLLVNLLSAWLLTRSGGHAALHGHGDHGHGEHGHGDPRHAGAQHKHPHDDAHDHSHGQPHDHDHERNHERDHEHPHEPAQDQAHGHAHGAMPASARGGAPADHHDHNFRAAYLHVMADALTSVLAIVALAGGLWAGLRWLDPAVALLGGVIIGRWSLGVLKSSARALVDVSADSTLASDVRRRVQSDGDATVADLHVWQIGPRAYAAVVSVVADKPLSPAHYQARLGDLELLQHVTIEVHRCQAAPSASTER